MTAATQVRNRLTRTAMSVRAGLFLTALFALPASGQVGKPHAAPAPRFRPQQSRPQPQYRSQVYQPQQQRQVMRPQTQLVAPGANRPMEQPTHREQPGQRPGGVPLVDPGHPGQMSQHLGPWMQAHSNLPLTQQHQALDNEPGFHSLQPAEQERLHNQLSRLNNMAPAQRQLTIQRNETMERLSPPQRLQVRNALGQLGSIPSEDRQRAVYRAYKQLRDLPPGQSQAILNSPLYRGQFNDQERTTIGNMVTAAPLLRGFEAGPQVPQVPHN